MTATLVLYLYNFNTEQSRSPDKALEEAVTLCHAIDLDVCFEKAIKVRNINPGQIFSNDRLEEIQEIITAQKIQLLIINGPVSPIQQRNLEKILKIKVLDRTGLILEIFGRRAATKEGQLQVELARMKYQKSRLVKAWSHLERQRGGGGFTGGPGETQKEADRRMIDTKILRIEKALSDVVKTRKLHRSARKKVPYPIIALAGYTNAGKSTLFNRLTNSDVTEADMLFATLDPTLRTVNLPSGDKVIISDTVGFISDLPTQLVKAFRATLEEVLEADLVLHVRDIASEEAEIQRQDVENVLNSLDEDRKFDIIEIFNKTDICDHNALIISKNQAIERNQKYVTCSAKTSDNIQDVLYAIDAILDNHKTIYNIKLPMHRGEVIADLNRFTHIMSQAPFEEEMTLEIQFKADKRRIGILRKKYADLEFCNNITQHTL